jgi:hypothetical protein
LRAQTGLFDLALAAKKKQSHAGDSGRSAADQVQHRLIAVLTGQGLTRLL